MHARSSTLLPGGALALLVLLLGCNENALNALNSPPQRGDEQEGDDDDSQASDDDDDDPTGDNQNEGDDDVSDDDDAVGDDDDDTPPPKELDACPDGGLTLAEFYGPDGQDEIYVLAYSPTEATGTLVSPIAGLFDVYDTSVAESGSSQMNETGFVRIRNSHSSQGEPVFANCGLDWLVMDTDNDGPPPNLVYVGTFDLDEGDNELTLYHFCPLYQQGYCTEFHTGDPNDNGCNDGPHSIHFNGQGLCLVPR